MFKSQGNCEFFFLKDTCDRNLLQGSSTSTDVSG